MPLKRNQTVKIAFTKTRLEKLAKPDSGRVYVYDANQPGLALCITSNDARTFYLVRWVKGRPVRVRLGKFPGEMTVEQARTQARRLLGEIAEGRDPQAARIEARKEPTIADLFDYYIEKYAKVHTRSWKEAERLYKTFVQGWASRRLSVITHRDVEALHAKIGKDHGPYAANRVVELLRAAFNKGDKIGFKGENPAIGVERFPEQKRDRFLNAAEIKRFFEALAKEDDLFVDFFTLALLTGARRSNVQAMKWEDINFELAIWKIGEDESKNGQPIYIPLAIPAVKLLAARKTRVKDSPWVFPTRSKSGHLVEPKSAWQRICKAAELEGVRLHDLRRTLGSWQAAMGASLPIIGKSLGHRDGSPATAVYARLDLDPVRQSVEGAVTKMLEYQKAAEAAGVHNCAQKDDDNTKERGSP